MKSGHLLLILLCLAAGCKAMPDPAAGGPAAPTSAAAGGTTIVAIAPPAAPQPTLWGFLGLDRLFGAIYAKEMRKLAWLGTFFPGLEPTTAPLRPLADPANLDSPNPAVKAAAAAKADIDAAPQKIKALKFLGSIGCDSHPDVEQALLSGLEDPIEGVRYAAASALYEAAGNPCETCDGSRCCSPPIRRKLHEIGYKMDDTGCYVEPSARVRRVARLALNACGGDVPPLEPIPDELPPIEGDPSEMPPPGSTPPPAPSEPVPAPGVAERNEAPLFEVDTAVAESAVPMTRRQLLEASRNTATGTPAELPGSGDVVAVVNGERIYASEINSQFEQRLEALGTELEPEQQRVIFTDVMQRAVHDRLLLQEARLHGNSAAVAHASYAGDGPPDSQLAGNWLESRIAVDEAVAPEMIVARYEQFGTAYREDASVRWEQVRVSRSGNVSRREAKALIDHLWDRAVGVSSKPPKNVDPKLAETKVFDWTTRKDLPSRQLGDLLFRLPIGQVSDVLEDADGYSIVRVLQRRGPRRLPLADVSGEIRAEIVRERRLAAEQEYLTGLRRGAEIWTAVEVFEDLRPPSLREASAERR